MSKLDELKRLAEAAREAIEKTRHWGLPTRDQARAALATVREYQAASPPDTTLKLLEMIAVLKHGIVHYALLHQRASGEGVMAYTTLARADEIERSLDDGK